VWDSGGNSHGSSTSNFISNLFKSLPPLQEISEMAGFELPEYLGKVKDNQSESPSSKSVPDDKAKGASKTDKGPPAKK
jgi:flotillin